MRVCACMCVRLPSKLLIISGMMWHDMDPYILLNKFYNLYMTAVVVILLVSVAFELKHIIATCLIRVS